MSQKILVVDDDPVFIKKAKELLEKYGFEVWTIDNLKEAEEICVRQRPDLAILDLLSLDSDAGFVLAYRLKQQFNDLPVIIISSVSAKSGIYFNIDSKSEKDWLKADAILEKDISPEQLLKEIFKLLKI